MPISNYDDLIKTVVAYSHRDDVQPLLDTFLQLTETEIYSNPDEPLKLLALEISDTATTSTTSRTLDLPSGITRQTSIRLEDNDVIRPIPYTNPTNFVTLDCVSVPTQYTITNGKIEFNTMPDDNYPVTVNYESMALPLSDSNQTNEVLTKYPNVYLFGMLSNLFTWAMDDEQGSKYSGMFLQAIIDANRAERAIKYPVGINKKAARVL